MAQRKTSPKTPWTKDDVRELKAHSKARIPLPVIAKKMRRTERALRRRAGILGIGLCQERAAKTVGFYAALRKGGIG